MRMTSRFDGKCATCGKILRKGTEIEYTDKKAYHPECPQPHEQAALAGDPGQLAVAERLGFRHYPWDELRSGGMAEPRNLRDLLSFNSGEEPRQGSTPHGGSDSPLSIYEGIVPLGG